MTVKRTFIPGDEWLYYKIYCGARTADTVLTETLKPLTEQLLEQEHITKWFFIRYSDPEFHIRIRFHVKDATHTGDVVRLVQHALNEYVEEDVIYDVQLGTYQREIERYGARTVALSETLFYYESNMLLSVIALVEDEKLYFLFILRVIDQMLTDFQYTLEQKQQFTLKNSTGFKNEFRADRTLNKQLDKKYRSLKNELVEFLDPLYSSEEYNILAEILARKTRSTIAFVLKILDYKKEDKLEIELDNLVSSYIHMLVNRAFRSRQRFYELVCYEFLKRYYMMLSRID